MFTWRAEVFYEDQSRLKVLHVQIKGKYDLLLHKRENTGGIYASNKFERAREMKQKFEQIRDETDLDGERAAVLGYHRGSQGFWRLLYNYFETSIVFFDNFFSKHINHTT